MIVSKFVQIVMFGLVAFASASISLAQEAAAGGAAAGGASASLPISFSAVGTGLVVIGAAYGIGKLAASALESMARHPEVAASIQTAMIIAAALIEGATFFGLIVCIIA